MCVHVKKNALKYGSRHIKSSNNSFKLLGVEKLRDKEECRH